MSCDDGDLGDNKNHRHPDEVEVSFPAVRCLVWFFLGLPLPIANYCIPLCSFVSFVVKALDFPISATSRDHGDVGDCLSRCHVERRAAQATGVLEEGSRRPRASSPMRQEPEESVQAECTQGGVERGDKNEETSRGRWL